MNVFTSFAEVESFCVGIFFLLIVALSFLVCDLIDHIKINNNIRKIEKRVNILFKYIQHFVPDGQYVSADQFLDMHPDFDYFDD